MVVIVLILLSLGVAMFIMLSDTRKNDNFKRLDQGGDAPVIVDAGSDGGDSGGGDGGGD
jgi:hypothetical protein